MSIIDPKFNALAAGKAAKKKHPPRFSLRLTCEERARLEADAAGKPLGAYIRERLSGKDVAPRKRRSNGPIRDHEALGVVPRPVV